MTDPRPPMKRDYTRVWLAVLLTFLVTEAAAIARGKPGGTLSQHVYALQERGGWEGAVVLMVWGWLGVHFTIGRTRGITWWDAVAVFAGLALWYLAVYLRVRGAR